MTCPVAGKTVRDSGAVCRSCQRQGVMCPVSPLAAAYDVLLREDTATASKFAPQTANGSRDAKEVTQKLAPATNEIRRSEKKRAPNKTETEYARILSLEYPGAKVRYEAITLRLDAGFRYTADWCVTLATGETMLVEVKNAGFKHASYGRSKLAFSQAVIDFPMFKFRWAEKDKTGWTVTDY